MDDVEESVGDQEDEFLSEQQEVYFLDLYNSATCSVLQASSKDLQEADEAMKKLGLAKVSGRSNDGHYQYCKSHMSRIVSYCLSL